MELPGFWLSVDPSVSKPLGVAIWHHTKLHITASIPHGDIESMQDVLFDCDFVLVESGYVGFKIQAMALERTRGWIEALAGVANVNLYAEIDPSEWRSILGLLGGHPKSPELKARSRALLRRLAGFDAASDVELAQDMRSEIRGLSLPRWAGDPKLPEDQGEAILLGLAWAKREGWLQKQNLTPQKITG